MTGGTFTSSGQDSPGIYSTGTITVSGATVTASGAEAAVIEGSNSITLSDVDLATTIEDKWGVMIYQSMSGDAEGAEGDFTMTGGSLTSSGTSGPLFYVTNSTGLITLDGVDVDAASGTLLSAATGDWGDSGANGGTAILVAVDQDLSGDILADAVSSASVSLSEGSTLSGATTNAALALDDTSTWSVTGDSTLTTLEGAVIADGTVTNITGNGFTVTCDASLEANAALAGGTYTLTGGGTLTPA